MNEYRQGQLRSTVRRSSPRKLVAYYRGYLYVDRMSNEALDLLAKEAMLLERQGLVHLLQRKMGDWDYMYFFVRK